MQPADDNPDDKRDFFRIQETLFLDYRIVPSPEADAGFGERSPLFGLLSDLHRLDYESQHLLRQIAERDRGLAHYLKIINKRIDLIGKAVSLQVADEPGHPTDVTLSEGGMSFSCDEALNQGDWLSLRLVLQPTPLGLVLPAQVIRCDRLPDSPRWIIAVSFDALDDQQRQLLARHILQKQAQDIRAARSTPQRTAE
ncbi:PilZ domain-containing protein [Halopseudomonas xinjiangensis]|uniref:PilZ domain-containing protein n=1 Tax=Halopseudomonas xinjiangensis TaxID=487184 RepID=A0A1H1RMN3_9GAMM|nr:PilZ domain-containing protein [Halopseudomonas xinjiangensis]SDS36968.1 PilZ domain-containing protein [Halopseudomonas xinjiangensis]